MLDKFIKLLDNLKINEKNMMKNLDKTNGLIFSQKVLLVLMDKGLSREESYQLVQNDAMKAWEKEESFRKIIESDSQTMTYLNKEEVEKIFDYNSFISNIDYIFERGKLE